MEATLNEFAKARNAPSPATGAPAGKESTSGTGPAPSVPPGGPATRSLVAIAGWMKGKCSWAEDGSVKDRTDLRHQPLPRR